MLSSGNSLVIPGALVKAWSFKVESILESHLSHFNRSSLRPRRAERFAMVTKANRTKARITGFLRLSPFAFHIPHRHESLAKNFTLTAALERLFSASPHSLHLGSPAT